MFLNYALLISSMSGRIVHNIIQNKMSVWHLSILMQLIIQPGVKSAQCIITQRGDNY